MKTVQLVAEFEHGESILYQAVADYVYVFVGSMSFPIVLCPGQTIKCVEVTYRKPQHYYY